MVVEFKKKEGTQIVMPRVNIPFDLTWEELECLKKGTDEIGGLVIRNAANKRFKSIIPVAGEQYSGSEMFGTAKGIALGVGAVVLVGGVAYGLIRLIRKESKQKALKAEAAKALNDYDNAMLKHTSIGYRKMNCHLKNLRQ